MSQEKKEIRLLPSAAPKKNEPPLVDNDSVSEPGVGCYRDRNGKKYQEDAMVVRSLGDELNGLTPEDIGNRLWTTYRQLHQEISALPGDDGSTASTTVYDGGNNLITATLADAASFLVIYGKEGEVLGVERLNSVTHKPEDPVETARIHGAGGFVIHGRVNMELAVSRALGDKKLNQYGLTADATVDVNNISEILKRKGIDPERVGSRRVITTSDGFTDGAKAQTKEGHEKYVQEILEKDGKGLNELEVAKLLVNKAKTVGDGRQHAAEKASGDNITVVVHELADGKSMLIGAFDGHGGKEASEYAAQNIGRVFTAQCGLTSTAYKEQELSVNNLSEEYEAAQEKTLTEKSLVRIERQKAVLVAKHDEAIRIRDTAQSDYDNTEEGEAKTAAGVKLQAASESVDNLLAKIEKSQMLYEQTVRIMETKTEREMEQLDTMPTVPAAEPVTPVPKPKTMIFSDFDGTLTSVVGETTTSADWYQKNVLAEPGNYAIAQMRPRAEIVAAFKEKYGEYDPKNPPNGSDLLSPAAVKFLKEALADGDIGFHIISKNRKEYIQAVLAYQGFSEEEINKLKISDVNQLTKNGKGGVIERELNTSKELNNAFILDDDPKHLVSMENGAKGHFKNVSPYLEKPGTFDWDKIGEDVKNRNTPRPKVSQAPVVATSDIKLQESTPVAEKPQATQAEIQLAAMKKISEEISIRPQGFFSRFIGEREIYEQVASKLRADRDAPANVSTRPLLWDAAEMSSKLAEQTPRQGFITRLISNLISKSNNFEKANEKVDRMILGLEKEIKEEKSKATAPMAPVVSEAETVQQTLVEPTKANTLDGSMPTPVVPTVDTANVRLKGEVTVLYIDEEKGLEALSGDYRKADQFASGTHSIHPAEVDPGSAVRRTQELRQAAQHDRVETQQADQKDDVNDWSADELKEIPMPYDEEDDDEDSHIRPG